MALNLPFLTQNSSRGGSAKPGSIGDFVAQVKSGALSRQNRFAVLFTPPAGVNPQALRKVLLFCDTIQLPGTNFSTIQNRTYGEFREVPYEKLYDAVNMTFYVDLDLKVKELFDRWVDTVQNPVTRNWNYYNNYITNMVIEVQDINDNTRYEMTLWECYPKSIGAINLDHSSKEVMKLPITMQYKYWTAEPKSPLSNGQKVPLTLYEKMMKNFSGFQETLNNTLGTTAGNFITGSALTYGVTKIPGLLKF
jgi:hypothetical protein